MDLEAYREFIAILEDLLTSVYAAESDLPADKVTADVLRQMKVKLEQASQAYREKLDTHWS